MARHSKTKPQSGGIGPHNKMNKISYKALTTTTKVNLDKIEEKKRYFLKNN